MIRNLLEFGVRGGAGDVLQGAGDLGWDWGWDGDSVTLEH